MKKIPSLYFCLLMDIAGMATYTLPVFGEYIDLIWAPISALIFYFTFGGKTGKIGGLINFAEEILPGTDIIPTFTLAYLYRRFAEKDVEQTKSKVKVKS